MNAKEAVEVSSKGGCVRVRIEGVLDVVLVSDADKIHWLNEHEDIVRPLDPSASWLHRLLDKRLLSDLSFDGHTLPVFLARSDPARAERQKKLGQSLEKARGMPGEERVNIADYVSGRKASADIGVAVQQWCGRLFFSHYRSAKEIFAAGRLLATWPAAPPWRTWAARACGRLARAKTAISEPAENDLHCVHGTSIGMENVLRSVNKMREMARLHQKQKLSPDDAMRECLTAPPAVLRGCSRDVVAPFLARPLTRRTIVVFLLAKAYAKSGELDVAFLSQSWSACPARDVIPEMLRAVWYAAHHEESDDKPLLDTIRAIDGWSRLWHRAVSGLEGRA